MSKQIVVVGGGAAGMMAAISAAEGGASVTLLEPNERLGKKLNITGKGRCNVTNNADAADAAGQCCLVMENSFTAPFARFDGRDTMAFFEALGVPLKTERGNRVFPVSDRAFDISGALERRLRRLHVSAGPGPGGGAGDQRRRRHRRDGGAGELPGPGRDPGHRRRQLSRHRLHRRRAPAGGPGGPHGDGAAGLPGAPAGAGLRAASGPVPAECGPDGL